MPNLDFHQPVTQVVSDHLWKLVADYQFIWPGDNSQLMMITVPKGFVFNGASVPQIFWSLGIQPHGLIVGPATIHDFLYRSSGEVTPNRFHVWTNGQWAEKEKKMTRKEVDLLFKKMMEMAGISWWRKWSAYYAVRAFGKKFWGAN